MTVSKLPVEVMVSGPATTNPERAPDSSVKFVPDTRLTLMEPVTEHDANAEVWIEDMVGDAMELSISQTPAVGWLAMSDEEGGKQQQQTPHVGGVGGKHT